MNGFSCFFLSTMHITRELYIHNTIDNHIANPIQGLIPMNPHNGGNTFSNTNCWTIKQIDTYTHCFTIPKLWL